MLQPNSESGDFFQPQRRRRFSSRRRMREDRPKKAVTSFLQFLLDKRPQYIKEHSNLTFREATLKMGQIWNKMSDQEKQPYKDKSKQEVEKYWTEKERQNKDVDLNVPKPGKGAFHYFVQAKKEELNKLYPNWPQKWTQKQVRESLRVLYKELTKQEKAPYLQRAATDQLKYTIEKKAYYSKTPAYPVDSDEYDSQQDIQELKGFEQQNRSERSLIDRSDYQSGTEFSIII